MQAWKKSFSQPDKRKTSIPVCKSRYLPKPMSSFSFPYKIQSLQEKFLLEVKQFIYAHNSSTSVAPFTPQDTTLQCSSLCLRIKQCTQISSPGS